MTMSRTAPINGEILVDAPSAGADHAVSRNTVVEDADFITLDDAGSAAWPASKADEPPVQPQSTATFTDGLGILRPRAGAGDAGTTRAGQALYAAVFVLAVGATFWFSGGYALVGKPSAAARQPSPAQVRIAKAESRFAERADGPGVIVVNGTVANDSADAQGVPPIAVKVTAGNGRSQRYVFGTQNRILNGGQSMDFAYRLDVPASGVENVEVVLTEN